MANDKMRTMDGTKAAAYVSYAFTECASIFPITPSSPKMCIRDRGQAVNGGDELIIIG